MTPVQRRKSGSQSSRLFFMQGPCSFGAWASNCNVRDIKMLSVVINGQPTNFQTGTSILAASPDGSGFVSRRSATTIAWRRPARAGPAWSASRAGTAWFLLRDAAGRRHGDRDPHAGARRAPAIAPDSCWRGATRRRPSRSSPRRNSIGALREYGLEGELHGALDVAARGSIASVHRGRHVALHRLLPLRADLRRGPGPVGLARPGPRARDAHRARRPEPARELVRELRRVRRHLSDRRAGGRGARRRWLRPSQWTRTTCPYCGVGLRDERRHARRPHRRRSGRCSTRRSARATCASRAGTRSSSCTPPIAITEPMIRERRSLAARVVDRGARVRRRAGCAISSIGTARTASACSARRGRPTRTTTSRRSSRARSSAPTTSTAARASATRRAPPALKTMLGAGPGDQLVRRHRGRPRRSSSAAPTPTEDHPIVGARIKQAARRGAQLIVIDPRRIELAEDADMPSGDQAGHERRPAERDGAHDRHRGTRAIASSCDAASTASTSSRSSSTTWPPERAARDLRRRRRRDPARGAAVRDRARPP